MLHRLVPFTCPRKSPSPDWAHWFAVDLRSLALFRIALGLLMIGMLAFRTVEFRVFFTDAGVWPVAAAWAEVREPGMWSLHFLSGSYGWQAALWVAEACAGLALVLGWQTRPATVLAWLLVASAQRRNPMLVDGGAVLLHLLLFWGMWLPLGACWSVDAWRRRGEADVAAEAISSMASAALLIQVALIYVFNALEKSDPAWRTHGDAIWIALSKETYSTHAGRALLAWPGLLRGLTHAVFALEALGPWLALSPWATARCRTIAVASFMGLHAGLGLTMHLGWFPLISIAGWLPFIPSEIWRSQSPGRAPQLRSSWPVSLATALCLLLVLGWNLRPWWPQLTPGPVTALVHALRLEQRWAMFAPAPRAEDEWFVVVGTDALGTKTNLLNGDRPVNWRRPRDFAEFAATDAWRLYYNRVRRGDEKARLRCFADWLVRRWQREHPGAPPLVKVEIFYLVESISHRNEVPDNYLVYSDPPEEPEKATGPATDQAGAESARERPDHFQ